VIALIQRGRKIEKVTFDQFQSYDSIQILENYGINCDIQSVDTSLVPYSSFKEGIYSDSVICPHHEIAKKELKKLVLVKQKKVDHPKNGSKDVADAMCGAYFSCINYSG